MDDRLKTGSIAFGVAAALYAFLSSPTPDTPGIVEGLIIALLLVVPVCGGVTLNTPWAKPLLILLGYGASIPVMTGLFNGASAGDMARDLVAFAALGLPVLLTALCARQPRLLLFILVGIGLVFSLRYLASPDMVLMALATGPFDERLLYLANSPLVFFAALWLLLQGSFAEKKWPLAVLYMALSLIPMAAMAGMMQRATLTLLVTTWICGLVYTLVKEPARGVALLGVAVICVLALWAVLGELVSNLVLKTQMVGLNARAEEWRAIFAQIDQDFLSAAFGRGWGALMQSPAVADEWVRFSHSLLSAMLWKGGWIGLILTVASIGALILYALRRTHGQAVTVLALVIALIPACFLYGSYKSLCFGLLLTGLAALPLDKQGQAVLTTRDQNA